MSIIYKTTNLINGKIYVGQHFTSADDGYLGSGLYLKRAIKKYGRENFIREILEHCKSKVNEKEIYWIAKLKSTNYNIGYNFTKGGDGGDTWSGRHHTEETKKILKEKRRFQIFTEKTKKKISESKKQKHIGIMNPNNKYEYMLSNGKNYWEFSKKEKAIIFRIFLKLKSNTINYNGMIIERRLKNGNL